MAVCRGDSNNESVILHVAHFLHVTSKIGFLRIRRFRSFCGMAEESSPSDRNVLTPHFAN